MGWYVTAMSCGLRVVVGSNERRTVAVTPTFVSSASFHNDWAVQAHSAQAYAQIVGVRTGESQTDGGPLSSREWARDVVSTLVSHGAIRGDVEAVRVRWSLRRWLVAFDRCRCCCRCRRSSTSK